MFRCSSYNSRRQCCRRYYSFCVFLDALGSLCFSPFLFVGVDLGSLLRSLRLGCAYYLCRAAWIDYLGEKTQSLAL